MDLLKRIGFIHAWNGLVFALKTQLNLKIHLIIAIVVITTGWYFSITRMEWLILIFTMLLVFVAEMVNTAIEAMTDLITIKFSKHAKEAKDVAAGLVLISAMGAVVVGLVIFWPYFGL